MDLKRPCDAASLQSTCRARRAIEPRQPRDNTTDSALDTARTDGYVVACAHNKFYVGISANPQKRITEHRNDARSLVARACAGAKSPDTPSVYPEGTQPLVLQEEHDHENAREWERRETLANMLYRGVDNVRGAQHSQSWDKLQEETLRGIAREICHTTDACYSCGRTTHKKRLCPDNKRLRWLESFFQRKPLEESLLKALQHMGPQPYVEVLLHAIMEDTEVTQATSHGIDAEHQDSWKQYIEGSVGDWKVHVWTAGDKCSSIREAGKRIVWIMDGLPYLCVSERSSADGETCFLVDFASCPKDGYPDHSDSEDLILVRVSKGVFGKVSGRCTSGSGMAFVPASRCKNLHGIPRLELPRTFDRLANDDLPVCKAEKSIVFVRQDPPGSGKTYWLVRLALCPEEQYSHYDNFIFVTKPHSAKEVVHREFKAQLEKLRACCELLQEGEKNKAYWKIVRRADGKEVKVWFATGDSLVWAINSGQADGGALDQFEGMCKKIAEVGPRTDDGFGHFKFKGQATRLYGNTLLCVDEATKFGEAYVNAFAKMSFLCKMDVVVCGDVLQSLEMERNALTLFRKLEFEHLNRILETGNKIRRCGSELVRFVAQVTPWEKFDLPLPVSADDVFHESQGEFQIVSWPVEEPSVCAEKRVQTVLEHVESEAKRLLLLPKDILCVFLFVSTNPFADALRDGIDGLFRKLLEDDDYCSKLLASTRASEATAYFDWFKNEQGHGQWLAFMHRSEGNEPVDTSRSTEGVRMVSVHASQGDGRKLSLVFNLSEQGIVKFTAGETKTQQFHSFINVASSRAKIKTIIFLEEKRDRVWEAFEPFMSASTQGCVAPQVWMKDSLPLGQISFDACAPEELKRNIKSQLEAMIKTACEDERPVASGKTSIIEYEHHCVRSSAFHLTFLHCILRHETCPVYNQAHALLGKIQTKPIVVCENPREYHKQLREHHKSVTPLLQYDEKRSNGNILRTISQKIRTETEKLRNKALQDPVKLLKAIKEDPRTALLLWYMIQVHENGYKSNIRMNSLVDIFKSYELRSEEDFLPSHYDTIRGAEAAAEEVIRGGGEGECDGKWMIYLKVSLGRAGNGEPPDDFNFSGEVSYAHVSTTSVNVVLLQTQLSEMYLDRLASDLFVSSVLCHSPGKGAGENFRRFHGKNLTCWIVSMDDGKMVKAATACLDALHPCHEVVLDTLTRHLSIDCQNHHRSVLAFHEHCLRVGRDTCDELSTQIALKKCKVHSYITSALDAAKDNDYTNVPLLLENRATRCVGRFKESLKASKTNVAR